MATVYIETTIPSYYFETRRTARAVAWREATRTWWRKHRAQFRLVTSQFVLEELSRAPEPKRRLATALIRSVLMLDKHSHAATVARNYIEHHLMPAEAAGDAVHLALASLHKVDFLLTWNCRHLANANKIQHLETLNRRMQLHVPIITTPFSLLTE